MVDLTGEQLIEVVKAKYSGRIGHLLIGESRMTFADLYPKMVKVKEEPSTTKTVAVTALFGVVAGAAYAASKSRRLVDAEEKKHLREVLESYRETRDKNVLKSVSMEQVLRADYNIELADRIVPYSSISEVRVKELGKIIITQQVRTGLAAEIYGSSTTWKFDVLEDNKLFLGLVKLLQQLLPSKVFI